MCRPVGWRVGWGEPTHTCGILIIRIMYEVTQNWMPVTTKKREDNASTTHTYTPLDSSSHNGGPRAALPPPAVACAHGIQTARP